jgi:hypothetical protein
MLRTFLIRYTVYLTTAFATFLACISGQMRFTLFLAILGLLGYMLSDTVKIAMQFKLQHRAEPYKLAFMENMQYFVFFFLALGFGFRLFFS